MSIAIFSRVFDTSDREQAIAGGGGKQGEKDRRYAHVSSDCPNLTEYCYIKCPLGIGLFLAKVGTRKREQSRSL